MTISTCLPRRSVNVPWQAWCFGNLEGSANGLKLVGINLDDAHQISPLSFASCPLTLSSPNTGVSRAEQPQLLCFWFNPLSQSSSWVHVPGAEEVDAEEEEESSSIPLIPIITGTRFRRGGGGGCVQEGIGGAGGGAGEVEGPRQRRSGKGVRFP